MSKLEKAKMVIKEHYVPCGIFSTRNLVGDPTDSIYSDDELQIDICYYYEYFEVFGLSDDEFSTIYGRIL